MTLEFEDLTEKILAACFEVSNELGCGFLELVYQSALSIALVQKGLAFKPEYSLAVFFRGQNVGQFYADFLVEEKVLIEIKAVAGLNEAFKAQLINYLKATGIEVGLLVNFGNAKLEFRRLHR